MLRSRGLTSPLSPVRDTDRSKTFAFMVSSSGEYPVHILE